MAAKHIGRNRKNIEQHENFNEGSTEIDSSGQVGTCDVSRTNEIGVKSAITKHMVKSGNRMRGKALSLCARMAVAIISATLNTMCSA